MTRAMEYERLLAENRLLKEQMGCAAEAVSSVVRAQCAIGPAMDHLLQQVEGKYMDPETERLAGVLRGFVEKYRPMWEEQTGFWQRVRDLSDD